MTGQKLINTDDELQRRLKAVQYKKGPEAAVEHRVLQRFVPVDEAMLSDKVKAELYKMGRAKISRNSRCVCGSGKRFKACCMLKG